MNRRSTVATTICLLLLSSSASARPGSLRLLTRHPRLMLRTRAASASRPGHGQRAYNDALQFARQHNLKHFTVNENGINRLVVNVPSQKIESWCKTFSKGKCYVEPFFNASNVSSPGWSMLRIGSRSYEEYGQGETYRRSTYSGRVAFPMSLSQRELQSTEQAIHGSRNLPFKYAGGIWSGTGQNCTDWLTSKIGQYTGVTTSSVKHHMRSLVNGRHSDRMTVMAVMTDTPVRNFGQEQLNLSWD